MGVDTAPPLIVASIQAGPLPLDREVTIERACELIVDAGRAGARFVIFPVSYVPGYPEWVWTIPAIDKRQHRERRAILLANAVDVPGDHLDRLCRVAGRARVNVALGISERAADGAALYNTILHIGEDGRLLGRHRALALASAERFVWTPGDGDTFGAVRYPFGLASALIGREHYLPLARHALYAWGIRLYLAFGRESGESWLATLRHIAREGQVAVIGPGTVLAPDGQLLSDPIIAHEPFSIATLDPLWLLGGMESPTNIGVDARPDIFRLSISRNCRRLSPLPSQCPGHPGESDDSTSPALPL